MSTFDSTKTRLQTLLNSIVTGEIQLPDFQRGWVWDDEHIRSLLVSIASAFPVGAIMLLEAGGDAKFKARPVEGVDPTQATIDKLKKLLLDGQQRLTSLTQVMICKQPVQTRDSKKKLVQSYYYIDIETALQGPENYEDAIISINADRIQKENFGRDVKLDLSTPEKEYEHFYFPCNQILNAGAWEVGLNQYDSTHKSNKLSRYMDFRTQVLDEFRYYELPIIELNRNNKKEAVCLVFEKVNTGGVELSVFELLTATYAADNVSLRDEWSGNSQEKIEGIQSHLRKQRLLREVQSTEFLQGLTLLHTLEKRQQDLKAGKTGKQVTGVTAKREAVLSLPLDAFQKWKQPLTQGYWKAAKFLRQESFFSTGDLPYRTQLIPLAAVMALLGDRWLEPKVYEKIARWFWCGILGELYGGAVETRMALDIQQLIDWIEDGKEEPATVRDANFQPARLGSLRSRTSAAYKGVNALIQREGAKDFFWKSTIQELDESDWEERKLDIHHIFPKSWCDKQGIPASRYNSILNKTPISYKANRMIGGKAPSEYLIQLQQHKNVQLDDADMDAILATHQIDSVTLRKDDFEGFMVARQRMILGKIEATIGKPVLVVDDSAFSDVTDEDE